MNTFMLQLFICRKIEDKVIKSSSAALGIGVSAIKFSAESVFTVSAATIESMLVESIEDGFFSEHPVAVKHMHSTINDMLVKKAFFIYLKCN